MVTVFVGEFKTFKALNFQTPLPEEDSCEANPTSAGMWWLIYLQLSLPDLTRLNSVRAVKHERKFE